MARKPRSDRGSVAAHVVSIRLEPAELSGLDALVRKQNVKLRQLGLAPVITRATYIRSLLLRELEATGHEQVPDGQAVAATSLVIHPPRKRPRASLKKMPGPVTIERVSTDEPPHVSGDGAGRRSAWERLIVDEEPFADVPAKTPPTKKSRKP